MWQEKDPDCSADSEFQKSHQASFKLVFKTPLTL